MPAAGELQVSTTLDAPRFPRQTSKMSTVKLKSLLRAFMRQPHTGLGALRQFVAAGGHVDCEYRQTTPLCESCRRGCSEVVRFLIDRGAAVNKTDHNECSPLFLAASHGRPEVVALLLARSSDPSCSSDLDLDRRNKNGYSALVSAVQNGHTECAQLLIAAGADVNVPRPDTLGVNIALLSYVLFGKGDYVLGEKLVLAGVAPYSFVPPLGFIMLEDPFLDCAFAGTLLAAGFNINCSGWLELMRYRDDHEVTDKQRRLLAMIDFSRKNAPSLQQLCRICVRKALAFVKGQGHLRVKVNQLPLPELVKKYVMMDYL